MNLKPGMIQKALALISLLFLWSSQAALSQHKPASFKRNKAASPSSPIIFNQHETASSGEVFGIQGANFGPQPQVWYAAVTGTEKTLQPTGQLKLVSASDRNISVVLPPDSTVRKGHLLAVWVRNQQKHSKPFFINRARAVTLEYDEIMPNQAFRIFGRNLKVAGQQPQVRFSDATGKKSWPAKVIQADAYVMHVQAPANIKPGDVYRICVRNGSGGTFGESMAEETMLGRASAPDPFNLKVPWGTDFTFSANIYNVKTDARLSLKAKGDGRTDDRAALQHAIEVAHKAGGGVVYLPAGNYRLDIPSGSGLIMRSRVVLQGEGHEKSAIQYGFGTPPPYPDPIGKRAWPDETTEGVAILWPLHTTLTGLYGLRFENVNASGKWRHSMKTMEPATKKPGAAGSRFFAANCRFDFAVAWGLSWGHVDRFAITDCVFNSEAQVTWPWLWHCNGATNFVVRNNRVRYAAGRFGFNDSYNGIIENNHITRLGDLQTIKGETGGFNIDYAADMVIMGNRMDVEGRAIESRNQGETILSQGCNPQQQAVGVATQATATSLTDARQQWKPIRTASLGSSDAVAIVDGKGAGQWRRIRSNTPTTLKLEQPWEIIPDKTSRYAIMRWSAEDWLVKDNILEDNNRGIWFYCGGNDLAIVENKLTNSDGIYLRADQRLAAGRYNLTWKSYVANNRVINTDGKRPAYIVNTLVVVASDTLHGVGSMGVEIRRNYVQAHIPNSSAFVRGEGYFNEVSSRKPFAGTRTGILGTVFENNKVANADIGYRLSAAVDQTILKDPVYRNVKTPLTESEGTVLLAHAPNQQDPFRPYLSGQAPRLVRDLGEELAGDVKIRRLVFHSREVKTPAGMVPTNIFAVIARPARPGKYPGLLVLHGGGGAAELDKATRWARRGYVVLTLDLPGIANPKNVPHSGGPWKTYAYGKQRFTAFPDITHSTIFEAVLAALQGLYLLNDQPDVIRERIGVTGISWGGYMTTMLSGLASPYIRASFSTYGSGFYDTNSTFLKELDKMPAAERETWLTYLDAGRRAKNIAAPFFIAAATNDNWFYPPAVMATLNASHGPVNHLFAPNANHSANVPGGTAGTDRAGWLKMEEVYFDYHLRDKGAPLPQINLDTHPAHNIAGAGGFKVRFFVESNTPITKAEVYYSTTDTLWTKRQWVGVPAMRAKDGWYEADLPRQVQQQHGYWFATVSDSRPVTVSSRMVQVMDTIAAAAAETAHHPAAPK